jgi:glycosyltransferase involved in cell wall biosynthesis
MMVKNEANFVRNAIWSVLPHIDHWVIVDTGSTDDTKKIIIEELSGIPGELHDRPWINWEYNRSEVIELAKTSGCDFLFILDADEKAIIPENYSFDKLDPNFVYWVTIQYGSMRYDRPNILSIKHNWHYIGITHEYLTCIPDNPVPIFLPITIETNLARITKTADRCLEDARILEDALAVNPEDSRYWFYLAQSYRDAGLILRAIKAYEKRASMGGWYEEVFYSLYQIAQLMERWNTTQE